SPLVRLRCSLLGPSPILGLGSGFFAAQVERLAALARRSLTMFGFRSESWAVTMIGRFASSFGTTGTLTSAPLQAFRCTASRLTSGTGARQREDSWSAGNKVLRPCQARRYNRH